MKKYFSFVALFLGWAVLFGSETYIESVSATSNGKDIIIEFKTSNEKNIASFEIERSINNGTFKKIGSLEAKGFPTYYKYIDYEAFLRDETGKDGQITGNNYSYRIKIIFNDNSFSLTNTVNVSHSVNGIYRTWGMIKAMFR